MAQILSWFVKSTTFVTLKQNVDSILIGKVNSTMFIHELRSSREAAGGSLVYRIVCFSLLDFEFLCGINAGAASIRDDNHIRLKLLRHFDSQLCIHNIKGRSWQRDGAHVRLLTPYGRLVGKVVLSSVLVTISKIDC